jgi:DNA-binding transcriptional MerR regulator
VGDRPYLSIGEVLGMLLEEFPDVSISKIRFLESQGLIDPERTPSGYRKFYDADVDRLRVILREQRQNFLPLRVIRDRLESGQIDNSGPMTPPRGLRNVTVVENLGGTTGDETGERVVPAGTVVPTSHHPAAQAQLRTTAQIPITAPIIARSTPATAAPPASTPAPPTNGRATSAVSQSASQPTHQPTHQPTESRHDAFDGPELCARAGITKAQLADLVSFGLIGGTGTSVDALYSTSDVAIAAAAAGLLERGVDARHLRQWRRSAELEAALFEQLALPLIRQRNPQSRQLAATSLRELSSLGGGLRAAILAAALQHHLET